MYTPHDFHVLKIYIRISYIRIHHSQSYILTSSFKNHFNTKFEKKTAGSSGEVNRNVPSIYVSLILHCTAFWLEHGFHLRINKRNGSAAFCPFWQKFCSNSKSSYRDDQLSRKQVRGIHFTVFSYLLSAMTLFMMVFYSEH